MSTSLARMSATAVTVGVTIVCYWLTFQPQRPFGPIPILLWLSIPFVAVGGLTLGAELSHQLPYTHRATTALAQIVSIALIQTVGIVVGWSVDPAFFDSDVIRTYYGVPLILGMPLIGIYHGVGWFRTRTTFSD